MKRLSYNTKSVSKEIVFNITAFFILYMITFGLGAAVFGYMGLDFLTSIGTAVSSLGNVGPSFSQLSPVKNTIRYLLQANGGPPF